MYTPEFLEHIKRQEEALQFPAFDREDAYALGTRLRELAVTAPEPLAVRVVLEGLTVYQSFLPGASPALEAWLGRKGATVARCGHSSLRAGVERELFGAKEPWQSDKETYTFIGGGFPIRVEGQCRGAVILSGFADHLEDHRYVCQAIARHLGKQPPPLPEG